MSDVLLHERAGSSFPEILARRGHHVVYRANSLNHCPGCGRSQWFVGRMTAECGYCSVAIPMAEARVSRPIEAARLNGANLINRRRFLRSPGIGRELQLLINGFPISFALQTISAGGLMGGVAAELSPGTEVLVRFEDGNAVPAMVKWSDGELVGLAFGSSGQPKTS